MYFNINEKFKLETDNLNDPILLIGWPGIALVGKLAISSIKDSIKARHFLSIDFFDFPPKSAVEKGMLKIPVAKIHYKARETNDLFILTANFQPQTPQGVFEFSKKFCEAMDKLTAGKIKAYISTGALIIDDINNDPYVHVSSTDQELLESFLEIEKIKMMDGGVIAGANGILPAWAGAKGFAAGACLLAETLPLPMMNIDPRASKALVSVLKSYLNIDMNFDELDKKIEKMEKIFQSFKKQADQIMMGPNNDKDLDTSDSYFR